MTRHDDDALWKIFGYLMVIPVSIVMRGWALTVLWAWFVTPLGLPEIGMAHAVGLSVIIGMLTKNSASTDDKDYTPGQLLGIAVVSPLLLLAFGWGVHLAM